MVQIPSRLSIADFLTLLAREKGVVTPIAHPLPENLNEVTFACLFYSPHVSAV